MQNANLRSGPGTVYPVIGGARAGDRLPVAGRHGDWWQVRLAGQVGWLWGGLVEANEMAHRAPVVTAVPPTPTPTPTPTNALTPTPANALIPHEVVLGPDTVYPVRARRIVGPGYELVDASDRYDLVLHRDVFGAVIRQFWGDKLFRRHPHGLRITLIDPEMPAECAYVCKSCPGQPTRLSVLAPIRLVSDWRGDCHARAMEVFGDGRGARIGAKCAYDYGNDGDAYTVLTDPEECFFTVIEPGPVPTAPTDLFVSLSIASYHQYVTQGVEGRTPDFVQAPFTPHLGQPYRDGDHWRWRDPFVEVVSAR
jgi:hypothetical protein